MTDMFACMVPGRQLITNFRQLSATHLVTSIPLGPEEQLNQIGITLLRPVQEGFSVGVYFSLQKNGDYNPQLQWQYLGQLKNEFCSDFFRVSHATQDIPSLELGSYTLHIGLTLESNEQLQQQIPVAEVDNGKILHSAKGIATDLHRFIASFERVPPNVIDRWYQRFLERHKREPYFWMQEKV